MKETFSHRPNRTTFLMVAAAVALVMALSLLMGLQAASSLGTRQILPVVLLLALLAIIVAVRYFKLAVLALPITALAVPINLSTGTESRVPISLIVTFLLSLIWCASMSWRGWRLASSPMNLPMIIFGAITIVSLAWGIVWRDPGLLNWNGHFVYVQIGALMTILLSLAAALLIGNFITTPGQLKYLMGLFITVCGAMLVISLLGITQSFLTIMGLWALWLIAPAYALLITQPGLRWRWRALLLLVLLLTFYQVLIKDSLWVSGWLPGIVAIFAMTFLRSRKAFVVLVIVAALMYQTPTVNNYFKMVAQENVDEGALDRISIWEQNWGVVRTHWLFGTGPAGYAIYYMTYYRDDARSTHNNYMDILAQFGFTGMFVWLWFVAASVREGWQLVRRAPPGFLRTMAIAATGGWIGAMASMFLGDWVLPFAYNVTITGFKFTVYSWIFLGTLIAIRQMLNQHNAAETEHGAVTVEY